MITNVIVKINDCRIKQLVIVNNQSIEYLEVYYKGSREYKHKFNNKIKVKGWFY